ncbi:hypothetical protein HYX02_02520 [Candidatus Woesearchaeota archaeon]|nr:hypothetical protein [Candidatus Woesearchaeota archaeon]
MEENYNWNLILVVSVPVALVEWYLFYRNLSNGWRLFSLIVGVLLAGFVVYTRNKKKSNVFTAIGIVLLGALIARLMRNSGF